MSKAKRKDLEKDPDLQGEGNTSADRRYREGVEHTVEGTTEKERAERARRLEGDKKKQAREAEEKGKSRARD